MAVDSEKNIVTGKDIYIEDAKKDFLNNINFIGETTQKTEEPIDWKEAQGNNLYLTNITRTEIKKINFIGKIEQEVIEGEEGLTIEGKSIYVDDVDTNKENSINIKGNTPTQETREGFNLINPILETTTQNGVTCTNNGDGTYTLEGTSTDQCIFQVCSISVNLSTSYKLIGCPSGGEINTYYITSSNYVDFGNGSNYEVPRQSSLIISIVVRKSGVTCNKLLFKPMLVTDESKTYDDFEQYGAMPSIEYPSEVNIADGNYDVKIQNKNIYSGEMIDGYFYEGNFQETATCVASLNYILVEGNKTYCFSLNGILNKVVINYYDRNKKWINSSANKNGYLATSGIFTIPENAKYIRVRAYSSDKDLFLNGKIQIEEGEIATDYIEHQEQVYTIDTTQAPLYSENDYYYKSGDKWFVHNEWIKYVITGDEYITLYSINNNVARFDIGNLFIGKINSYYDIYCNYLKNNITEAEGTIRSGLNNNINTGVIFLNSSIASSNEKLKAYLKNLYNNGTPLYVIYKLATPTETEITNPVLIEQLEALYNANLYETITNINSEGNTEVLPIIKLHYNFITPAPSINRKSEILFSNGNYDINIQNKNMLNIPDFVETKNGLTLTISRGIINIKGTSTISGTNFFKTITNVSNVEKGIEYTLERGLQDGVGNKHVNLFLGKNVDDFNKEPTFSTTIKTKTFTMSDILQFLVYCNNLEVGTVIDVTLKPQLEIGSQSSSYESHKEQVYPIDTTNRNLFNKNDVQEGYYYNLVGNLATSNNWGVLQIPVEKNSIYYMSGNNYNNQVACTVLLDEEKNFIKVIGGYKETKKIETTENTAYIGISVPINPEYSDLDTLMVSLFESDIYVPYTEPYSYPLYGENDDYYYKNNGKWFVHNEWKKIILDGSDDENWFYETNNSWVSGRFTCTNLPNLGTNIEKTIFIEAYCNFGISNSSYVNVSNGFLIRFINYTNRVDYMTDKFNNIEDFKNYLSKNNMILIYKMLTPIETEITNSVLIEQLEALYNAKLYENITNISLNNNIGKIYIKYDGYDGTPSLKHPSELLSIKGEQTVTIRNANKFILLSYQNPGTIFEQNGIMFIMNNDGSINIFGYAEEDAEWYLVGGIDKEYEPIMTLNNNNILQLYDNKNTNIYIYLINNKNVIAMTNSKNSFTYNGEIDTIMIRVNKGTSIDTTIYPILTDENENTDNIKSEQQLYTIRLGNIELNGNNNVRDTFEIEFSQDDTGFKNINKLYHNKNFNKYIFTGNETISLINITNDIARFNIENVFINKINDNYNIYCNYLRNEATDLENTIRSGINNFINTAIIFINKSIASTVEVLKSYLKKLYDEGNPLEVIYQLANPEKILIEDENLIQDIENLLNAVTYEGVNKIKSTVTIVIEYTVKYKDNYDFYIDKNNKFFYVPEYGIKFLFSPTESNIPEIAEASETSVKIAGKDGDEVLSTTYEPLSFDIVAYTDENLDTKQKILEISKVTRFLDSIKYKSKNLAILDSERMIPVKYNKNLTTERYPKSIKFTIPLKSSKAYTNVLYPTKIFGNGEEYSNTIRETGCIITIYGPAQSPVIFLNEYEIKYNNVILDGNKLVIDTSNSTVTHVTSKGIKTNAAAYYNHEYPKIQYGMNKIEIKSGIGYDKQVITEWYDLKN